MMKKRWIILFLFFLISEWFLNSCAPEACLEETESKLKATLFNNTTKKKASPDSLTLYGLNHPDEKIYDRSKGIQQAVFPLDASSDNCTFIIRINGISDTIKFRYTSNPRLISKECGYTVNFNLIDTAFYTRNAIDYIFTAKRKITTYNEENLRIFY